MIELICRRALVGLLAAAAQATWLPAARGEDNAAGAKPATVAAAEKEATADADKPLSPAEYYGMLREADVAFRGFDYPRAAQLYGRITRQNPYHGTFWHRLGRSQEQLHDYAAAIESFKRGLALGDDSPPGQTQYQLAILCIHAGDVQGAIDWLEKALGARHERRGVLKTDKRLDPLRSDPRFVRLLGAAENADSRSREERWNRDLDFLVQEAARMHILWSEGDRAEKFRAAAATLRQRIGELSDPQMLVEIQKLIVLLGDGHTVAQLRGGVPVALRLPLRLYFFSDGLFVIDAAEPYRDLIGCRIETIGNVDADEAERRLEAVVSRDNPMGIKANGTYSLVNTQVLQSLGIVEEMSVVPLEVTDTSGQRRVVKVEAGKPVATSDKLFPSKLPDAPAVPLYLQRTEENLWFEPLPEIDGVYVQFNDVRDEKDRQIVEVSRKLQEYLASHPTRRLVLDLRHNGGGNTYLYPPLLKALLYYELTQPEGQIFAIIGRATFSAAQNFTNDVDRLTGAIFVGEPTGSRPSFAGESTQTVLPYSGIGLSISTRLHQHAYATDRRIWIAPDVPAELSSSDYFANRDPALEAIREIASLDN